MSGAACACTNALDLVDVRSIGPSLAMLSRDDSGDRSAEPAAITGKSCKISACGDQTRN